MPDTAEERTRETKNSKRRKGWIVPRSAEFATATLEEIEEIAAIGDNLYALGNEQAEETLRRWRAATADSTDPARLRSANHDN